MMPVMVARPVRVQVTHVDVRRWRFGLGGRYLAPVIGRLLAIVMLLLFNGFFVAAEFALVRSRRTRLEAMARSGDRLARIAVRATSNISRVLRSEERRVGKECRSWRSPYE